MKIVIKNLFDTKDKEKNFSVKDWIPINKICDGKIFLKDDSFVKILEVEPMNFELKSNFEKSAILDGYRRFLKSCNFDMQIVIQTQVADISKHLCKVKKLMQDDEMLSEMSEDYINFANEVLASKKNVSRKFYIVIKGSNSLNENISRIKENLLSIRKLCT